MGNMYSKSELKNDKNGLNKKIKLKEENFEIIRLWGSGNCSKVYLVKFKKNDEFYAMKIISKNDIINRDLIINIQNERKILEEYENPFIIPMILSFQNKDNLYLIFEFIKGGELFNLLKFKKIFGEEWVVFISAQIVLALEFLHKHKIVYRDLKPENIMFDENCYIKLIDFGLAKIESDANTFCGTPEYFAPEILNGEKYDCKVDIWSLGILIFEMLTGNTPFNDINQINMFNKIKKEAYKHNFEISSDANSLIEMLINKQNNDRPSINIIKEHPFFKNINWENLNKKQIISPFIPSKEELENYFYFETDFSDMENFTNNESIINNENNSDSKLKKDKIEINIKFDDFTYCNRNIKNN